MSFQIDRGLAKFDYVDHHAILGVTLDATVGDIRKRYLKVARSLHPDSCPEANKQFASQLLSKLVNPAYEKLTQDRERAEYEVLLKLLGKRIVQEKTVVTSEVANQLLHVSDPDSFYTRSVQELAETQYQVLEQAPEQIGELSELNLAYLALKEGKVAGGATARAFATAPAPGVPGTHSQAASAQPSRDSTPPPAETFVNQYYRRAEEFLAKNSLQQAVVELREALKLDPTNSRCHGLIGTIYLRQNQITMAKVHFNQALKRDPRNSVALSGKQQLDKLAQSAQRQSGRGLFGFGKKK